jgi:hypothetical protein
MLLRICLLPCSSVLGLSMLLRATCSHSSDLQLQVKITLHYITLHSFNGQACARNHEDDDGGDDDDITPVATWNAGLQSHQTLQVRNKEQGTANPCRNWCNIIITV